MKNDSMAGKAAKGGIGGAELACLGAIVLLAAALRAYGLGQRSLWYDEIEQMAAARAPWEDFFAMIRGRHLAPPLDFLLMRPFALLGQSDALARAWAALAGVLCVPLIYTWARPLGGKATALLAALLLAASSFAISYAQEARMYSSFILFTLVSFIALERLHRAPGPGRALQYGLAGAAVLLTHYYGGWVLLLQAPWLVLGLKPGRRWVQVLGLVALAWAVVVLGFLPWAAQFLAQLKATQGSRPWGLPFELQSYRTLLELFSSGRSNSLVFGAFFVLGLGLALYRRERRMAAAALTALACLFLPVAASIWKPTASPRYMIFALAPYCLVVAYGIAQTAQRWRFGLPAASVVLLATLVPAALRDHAMGINAWKPRWHEAADIINAGPAGEPVLTGDRDASLSVGYYLRPFENHFLPQLRTPPPPAAFRVTELDEAALKRIEAGRWSGWVVLHYGANRNRAGDALAERLRKVAGPVQAHLPSPNEANGLDVLYCGKRG